MAAPTNGCENWIDFYGSKAQNIVNGDFNYVFCEGRINDMKKVWCLLLVVVLAMCAGLGFSASEEEIERLQGEIDRLQGELDAISGEGELPPSPAVTPPSQAKGTCYKKGV